ncbi:MAG: beta-lactamase family protein [Gemmatimonadetes bacterium]|nr:beta-lactamase family protein [Gemmatimonadota bacterium]
MKPASILPLLALGVAGTLQGQADARATRLDAIFAPQQGVDRPGCAVSVVDRGRLVVARGYGMADLAQGLAIAPRSIFHVASVSKQFTAMSLVLLERAGRLSLDDDVRKYVPELPSYGSPITIRHLLNHTSGLRDQWNLLITAGWRLGDDLVSERDVMDIVPRQRGLNFAPGTDWMYSNTGFTLGAVIVHRVTGQTLRAFADSALFKPLGMRDTHFHDDNHMIVPGRTRGYTRDAGTWKETVPNYSTVGATSLFTTVEDLARWHGQLAEGRVGGREAIAALARRGVLVTGDTLQYALGIVVGTYRGTPTLAHSGGDPGYSSYLLNFPQTGSGVAVLCNTSGVANPTRLAEQAADIYLVDQLGAEPALAARVAGAAVAGREGLYWSDSLESTARLAVDSGFAVWRVGPGTTPLRDGGAGRWVLGAGPASLSPLGDGTVRYRSGNGEPSMFRRVEEAAPTPAELAALAGRYRSDELEVTWELRVTGDSLMLHRRKFPPARLAPIFRDRFQATSGMGFVVQVQRDPRGGATGITVGSGRVRRMLFLREVPVAPVPTTRPRRPS